MLDKVLIAVNGYQITFGTLINCIVVINLFILCVNLFERLRIMPGFIFNNYDYIETKFDIPDWQWNSVSYEELSGNAMLEEQIKSLQTSKEKETVSHATICTQCGHTFKLAKDGTGRCPACDTYYSPVEVK